MWCSDPSINYLKSFGYSVVSLPKPDLRPLQILTDQGGGLNRLGELATVLASKKVPLPPISADAPTATISGQKTSDLSLGIGLSILGNVIGAMGGSKLGLDAKYRNAATVAFEFVDVLENNVQIAQLDQFLGDADINPASQHVRELLEADDIYVITDTIKSKKLTVEAKASSGASVALQIPDIQGAVGGNVKVSGDTLATSKLTYEGTVPLVFGFQAVHLYYSDGKYSAFEQLPPGSVVLRALQNVRNDGTTKFVSAGPFARLRS